MAKLADLIEPQKKKLADLAGSPKNKLSNIKDDERGFFADMWDFINSGANGGPGIFTDPVGWATNPDNPNLEQSAKSVAGGVTTGLTFGALEPFKDEVGHLGGYKAGEVVGEIAPLGALSKTVGGLKHLSKLPNLLRPFVAGAEIGAVTGTLREGVDVAKGGEFNPENIAIEAGTFALLDGVVGLGGEALKRAIRSGESKKFVEIAQKAKSDGKLEFTDKELKETVKMIKSGKATPYYGFTEQEKKVFKKFGLDETSAKLQANETKVAYKNVQGAPDVVLEKPVVTKGEEAILKNIKETVPETITEKTKDVVSKANNIVENPIRMHERLGTKGVMYDVARAVDNAANIESKEFLTNFHKQIKGDYGFFSRPKVSEKIGTFAIAQQKGGKEILEKMGIKEIPKLTEQELKTYNYMRDNLEQMYKDLQLSRQKAGLPPFPKVDNYFTFWRTVSEELNLGHNVMTMNPNNIFRKIQETPFRFKNKRIIDNYGEVNLDAFNVFEKYMGQAIRHKHLTPIISKFHQMLDGRFYSGFKLAEEAPQAYKDLNDWVNFISGVRPKTLPAGLSRAFGKLNQNISYAVLSYNLRSIGIQPTAIINSTAIISPKYVRKGVFGLFDENMRKFALKNSNHLASREFDVHVSDAIGQSFKRLKRLNSVRKTVGDYGIKPLQYLDSQTAMATWIGSYKRGKELLKMSKKEAINYADDIVIKTQASGSRIDVSKLQRNELGKLISPFQTFVINNWGFLTKDVAGIGNASITSSQARERVMRYMAGAMLTNVLFEDVMQTRSPFPAPIHAFAREMEKSDDEMKALWQAMLEMSEIAPVVGGGLKYGSSPFGAGVQTLTDANKVLSGNASTKKTLETLGKLSGFPATTQIKKLSNLGN